MGASPASLPADASQLTDAGRWLVPPSHAGPAAPEPQPGAPLCSALPQLSPDPRCLPGHHEARPALLAPPGYIGLVCICLHVKMF